MPFKESITKNNSANVNPFNYYYNNKFNSYNNSARVSKGVSPAKNLNNNCSKPPFKKANTTGFNKFNITNKGDNLIVNNTEVLRINIKNAKGEILQLPLKRFDEIKSVAKSFFMDNDLPERLLNPVIYKICEAMKSIYQTYNIKLNKLDRDYLFSLRLLYMKMKHEEAQEANIFSKTVKKEFNINESTSEESNGEDLLNLSSFSSMSFEQSEEELPFFNLNKSY
jgi:hypothetical protein